jgi:hypothetical protein
MGTRFVELWNRHLETNIVEGLLPYVSNINGNDEGSSYRLTHANPLLIRA